MAEINEEIFTYITQLHEKQILMLQEKTDELKTLIIESNLKERDLTHRVNNLKIHIIALEARLLELETNKKVNKTLLGLIARIICNWRLWFFLFTFYTCVDFQHFKAVSLTLLRNLLDN